MTWKITDPQGNEAAKISWEIVKWTRGRGLDIGAGMYRTFPHFITVDNNVDAVLFGHNMPRPDLYVTHAADLGMLADGQMDFVFSSHLLEHIEEDKLVKVIREWWRVVKDGGFMVLYVPDEEEYPKVGEDGANPDHKWNVSYNGVMRIMAAAKVPFDLMDFQKRNEGTEYSLYFVFQKVKETPKFWHHDRPRPVGKTAAVVRYGAIGDSMQAVSVLAGLKEQGYHVTLYCAEGNGYECIKTDPSIDEFYIQGRGQVPDAALPSFWAYHKQKFDLWVNLSESVEGGLLAMSNRPVDTYNPRARHQMLDWNYVERQHLIAGLPEDTPHRIHFYPTPTEAKWAAVEKKAFGSFVVLWALTGSSVHKIWPWLDNAVSGLLIDFPEVEVVFVGGEDGVIIEKGWEVTPRVHCRSVKYGIRESLALAQVADVVIGPETGVMNAVAMESMPKVIFLSHSSQENLTKHWVNTHTLASIGTVCKGRGNDEAPACHQMHYGWDRCTEAPADPLTDELYKKLGGKRSGAGIAQCQWDIGAQDAYKVIWHVVQWRLEEYAKRDGKEPPGVVHMSREQLMKVRNTLPAHMRAPIDVIEEAEAANEKSVIEVEMTILNTTGSAQALQFTTSGSFAFSVARDDIIRQAMLNLALLDPSEIPTAQEIVDCARVLNMIVKQLAGQLDRAPGFKMWQRYRGALFLSYSKYLYNLTGNANGDAWAGGVTGLPYPNLYNQSNLTATVAAGGQILNVGAFPTPVAININDFVGVQYTTPQGNTDIFWSTITAINAATGAITMASPLPAGSQANFDNYVWNYTTKAQRPMKILTAVLRYIDQSDTPLNEMDLQQYEALPTKTMATNVADPTAWYYEARMLQNNGHLYTDCSGAQDITKHIHAVFLREAMDFNNPGDAPEFPQEWFWHLSWMLSLGICPMFDGDWTPDRQLAFGLATTNAREGNPQTTAAYFQPDDDDSNA